MIPAPTSLRRVAFALYALGVPTGSALARPVEVGGSYTADLLGVVDGGVKRGSAWMARADVWADVDGAAINVPDVSLHADIMATHGPAFSDRNVGDVQTVSNVQADTVPHLYEAWAQWQARPTLAIKAGLIDLNSEFDVQATGALFLNSSHGIGPDFSQSGVNGPSIFPMMAGAVVVRVGTQDGPKARFGVFDAVAGSRRDPRHVALRLPGTTGALLVGEVEVPLGKGEVQVGAWRYTTQFDALLADRPRAPSQGAYALVEGPLAGKLAGWVRVAVADERANPIAAYIGGGLVLQASGVDLGLAIAHARAGAPQRRAMANEGGARRAETAIELTVARPLASWITVQPDVQYVVHPGWAPGRPNALIAGMRFSLSWPGGA